MATPPPQVKNLENITTYFKQLMEEPGISNTVFQSMNGIITTLMALLNANGKPGWTQNVVNEEGRPMFRTEEGQQFEERIQPFLPDILKFFDKGTPTMYGGNASATDANSDTITPRVKEQFNMFKSKIAKLQAKLDATLSENPTDSKPKKPFSMDSLDMIVLNAIKKIFKMDETAQKFASKFGILKLEENYDKQPEGGPSTDPHPFKPLQPLYPPITTPLSQIPIPARMLVMIVYTILDVARVFISVSPVDSPFIRKVLSILLAVADFLKGSWKKAIMSILGIFGQNYVLAGVIGKLFLDVLGMLGPDLQFKMALGTVDMIKSFIIGIVLQIYQITAIGSMRDPVIDAFAKIAALVEKNKMTLRTVLGLSDDEDPQPNYLTPTFSNIQNIQAVFAHDPLICSDEFYDALAEIREGNNNIMKFILFLLRIPMDDESRRVRCYNVAKLKDFTYPNYSVSATEYAVKYSKKSTEDNALPPVIENVEAPEPSAPSAPEPSAPP